MARYTTLGYSLDVESVLCDGQFHVRDRDFESFQFLTNYVVPGGSAHVRDHHHPHHHHSSFTISPHAHNSIRLPPTQLAAPPMKLTSL